MCVVAGPEPAKTGPAPATHCWTGSATPRVLRFAGLVQAYLVQVQRHRALHFLLRVLAQSRTIHTLAEMERQGGRVRDRARHGPAVHPHP